MMSYELLPKFEKEYWRFLKKYKTLDDDLGKFKEVLEACPTGVGKNFTIIHSSQGQYVVKSRLACRALRDKSLRIIYAYLEQEEKIVFIEIYFKGEKEAEDRGRIKQYLSQYQVFG